MKRKPKSLTVRAKVIDGWPRLRYVDADEYLRTERWCKRHFGWLVKITVRPLKKIEPA